MEKYFITLAVFFIKTLFFGNLIKILLSDKRCLSCYPLKIIYLPTTICHLHPHQYLASSSTHLRYSTWYPTDSVLSNVLVQVHLPHILLDLVPPPPLGSSGSCSAFKRALKNDLNCRVFYQE